MRNFIILPLVLILSIFGSGYLFLQYKILNHSDPNLLLKNLEADFKSGNYKQVLNKIFTQNDLGPLERTAPLLDKSKEIALEQVNNLGYTFYVGQIDYQNVTNITDNLKNQVTKIVYDAHFPESILKDTPIIILNNLALTGGQYIPIGEKILNVPDLKPDFLSEGGIYGTYDNSGLAVIYINKSIIAQGKLTETLTHELGHAIGNRLTDQDWAKYYQLRNIPINTARHGTNWNLSPEEDFAEVYKNTFTGLDVRTFYGLLTPILNSSEMIGMSCYQVYQDLFDGYIPKLDPNDSGSWLRSTKIDYSTIEAKITVDPKMQNCRREVVAYPAKHPNDYEYGTPYKSTVGPQTKSFINDLVNKLNLE